MDQDIINKMRARVEMCRRLAKHTHDDRTAKVLLQMADEGEADVKRLQASRGASNDGDDGETVPKVGFPPITATNDPKPRLDEREDD